MIKRFNKKTKKEVLAFAYFVAVVQPLMVLPQVYKIFSSKSATDVSLMTWSMLLFFNLSNFVYGWVFRIKPLIIGNSIWMIVYLLVVVGILIYR